MKEQNNINNQNSQVLPQMPMMQSPMPPRPMNRRTRWGRRLMSGKAFGFSTLPDWFAAYAVGTYAIALLGVNLVYNNYATEWYFWLFGIVWVAGFFYLSVKFSREWSERRVRSSKAFEKRLFGFGVLLRMLYAVFIYYFYISMTGIPHEFGSADSMEYIETARWLFEMWQNDQLWATLTELSRSILGDMGYPMCLLIPVGMIEDQSVVLLIQIIQAVVGAYTAVLIYRLTKRSMGEDTARIAAIFCMLHPVLICYVGMTLKEVIMTCLVVLFIDMGDRMLRERKYTFITIAPIVLVGLSIFLFRIVLGMIVFMALFFTLVMMDSRIVSWGKKVALGTVIAGVLLMAASENIMNEINKINFDEAQNQQTASLEYRYGEKKNGGGNSFAKYAGTAVFAPLIFTIPFPTMVDVGYQEDMRLIHGGNWMRNVVSGLVILAMFMLLLTGDWRKYTLPLAMLLGYLLMLAYTQFAHSLRFHIPVMPFEMMFAAYVITNMRKKHRNWHLIWCIFMVIACFGWNWMKLRGRGL